MCINQTRLVRPDSHLLYDVEDYVCKPVKGFDVTQQLAIVAQGSEDLKGAGHRRLEDC